MVTLEPPPPDPHPSPSDSPHAHRDLAESFGEDARRYDRARPHYPDALAREVLAGAPAGPVLDVGIGTGLSALPFRAAGARVVGLEIDPRMAAVARAKGFDVTVAGFEQWDGPADTFGAIIAGQTWHWIDPELGARAAARLLIEGGRFAAFWNLADPSPDIAAAFAEVYRRVDTGLPFTPWAGAATAVDGYRGILDRTTDGVRSCGAFTDLREARFDWQATVTTQAWLDQVPTMGGHQRMAPDRLAAVLEGLAAIVDDHGGSFTMNYTTIAILADLA